MGCRIISNGEITAIICGGKQDHVCNDKGSIIYEFSDGFQGTLFEKARIEKLNLNMCDEDKLYFIRQKDIDIVSESVSCSICGRPAIADAYWL